MVKNNSFFGNAIVRISFYLILFSETALVAMYFKAYEVTLRYLTYIILFLIIGEIIDLFRTKFALIKELKSDKCLLITLIFALLISISSAYFFHWEQIEGGHDQGNIFNGAV